MITKFEGKLWKVVTSNESTFYYITDGSVSLCDLVKAVELRYLWGDLQVNEISFFAVCEHIELEKK